MVKAQRFLNAGNRPAYWPKIDLDKRTWLVETALRDDYICRCAPDDVKPYFKSDVLNVDYLYNFEFITHEEKTVTFQATAESVIVERISLGKDALIGDNLESFCHYNALREFWLQYHGHATRQGVVAMLDSAFYGVPSASSFRTECMFTWDIIDEWFFHRIYEFHMVNQRAALKLVEEIIEARELENLIQQFESYICFLLPIRYIGLGLCLIIGVLLAVAYFTHFERKAMASMQRRKGPNVVGFWGLLQPLADGLKLLAKEIIIPRRARINLFLGAPLYTFLISLMGWCAIP